MSNWRTIVFDFALINSLIYDSKSTRLFIDLLKISY